MIGVGREAGYVMLVRVLCGCGCRQRRVSERPPREVEGGCGGGLRGLLYCVVVAQRREVDGRNVKGRRRRVRRRCVSQKKLVGRGVFVSEEGLFRGVLLFWLWSKVCCSCVEPGERFFAWGRGFFLVAGCFAPACGQSGGRGAARFVYARCVVWCVGSVVLREERRAVCVW